MAFCGVVGVTCPSWGQEEAVPPANVKERIATLIGRLGDPGFAEREAASEALVDIGLCDPTTLFDSLPAEATDPEVRLRCERLWEEIPRAAWKRVLPILDREDPEPGEGMRAWLRDGLPVESVGLLIQLQPDTYCRVPARDMTLAACLFLIHPEPAVRQEGWDIVECAQDPACLPWVGRCLDRMLKEGSADYHPIRIAHGMRARRLLPLIARFRNDPDADVARAAWDAIETLLDRRFAGSAGSLLRSKDTTVLQAAERTLPADGDRSVAVAILPLLSHPDGSVLYDAYDILSRLPGSLTAAEVLPYLDHDDGDVRAFACRILAQTGDAASAPRLIPRLADPDARAAAAAMDAIVALGEASTPERILPLLEAPDPELRTRGAELIGRFHDRRYAASIVPLVVAGDAADVDSSARWNALLDTAGSLLEIDDLPLLFPWTRDKRCLVRRDALFAIGRIVWGREKTLTGPLREQCIETATRLILGAEEDDQTRLKAEELLLQIGAQEELPEIARFAAHPDPVARTTGLYVHRALKNPMDLVPVAARLLEDPSPYVRVAAIQTLLDAGDTTQSDRMVRILEDGTEPADVRAAAVLYLGRTEDPAYEARIERLLSHSDPGIARAAVAALGEARRDGFAPQAIELLSHTDPGVSNAAAQFLEGLGRGPWGEVLPARLGNADPQLRMHVERILCAWHDPMDASVIAGFSASEDVSIASPARRIWRESEPVHLVRTALLLLSSADSRLREMGCEAIGRFGDPALIGRLLPLLEDADPGVRFAVEEALLKNRIPSLGPSLVKLLESGEQNARWAAAAILSGWGDRDAVLPFLHGALRDRQDGEAARLLATIGAREMLPDILPLLESDDANTRHDAAEAIGILGEMEHADRLLPLLEDMDESVRKAAIVALGRLGACQTLPQLSIRLYDEDPSVRGAAIRAFGILGGPAQIPDLLPLLADGDDSIRLEATRVLERWSGETWLEPDRWDEILEDTTYAHGSFMAPLLIDKAWAWRRRHTPPVR